MLTLHYQGLNNITFTYLSLGIKVYKNICVQPNLFYCIVMLIVLIVLKLYDKCRQESLKTFSWSLSEVPCIQ